MKTGDIRAQYIVVWSSNLSFISGRGHSHVVHYYVPAQHPGATQPVRSLPRIRLLLYFSALPLFLSRSQYLLRTYHRLESLSPCPTLGAQPLIPAYIVLAAASSVLYCYSTTQILNPQSPISINSSSSSSTDCDCAVRTFQVASHNPELEPATY